ncbi:Transcriptional regulatory protein pro1 [Aspergillus sp. HF37]|nr:Transcriptional regulatory protein pro1 [Aspergillus sp. HF37]
MPPEQPDAELLRTPTSPYEVGIGTSHQTTISGVPQQNSLSASVASPVGGFSNFSTASTLHGADSGQRSFNDLEQSNIVTPTLPGNADVPLPYGLRETVPMDERDRTLVEHFVDNVLGLVFPIIEVYQQGPARAREILLSLETNKTYFHCCMSVSAIHLKTNMGLGSAQIDHDIMKHRYKAVSHLCQDLARGTDHKKMLDATLGMIFFHCSVGAPNDYLPDIPWNDHLNAALKLLNKFNGTPSSFSLSLVSWIDILGATMLGKMPTFAHTYRSRHLGGISSGLRELMGCDDRIMYLISEVACLDALRSAGYVDDVSLCHHVAALSTQLDHTEAADPTLESPLAPSGAIHPQKLTKNISAVFRIAARIYLYSLLPGFDCHQPSNLNMVKSVADILPYIPSGPYGFDRSLVWPLLITGSSSVASSPFRRILTERAAFLGDMGDFGSFGKMFGLLQEVWRLADDPAPSPLVGSIPKRSSSPSLGTPGISIRKQRVHWRKVMRRNGWHFLLI